MSTLSRLLIGFLTLLLISCSGSHKSATSSHDGGDTITSRAELLTMVDHGSFVTATVADPWNPGKTLAAYALIPRDSEEKPDIPDGFTAVEVPLLRSLVDSSTNTAAINELGCIGAIAAVADGNYYNQSDTVAKLIAEGVISDIGNSMSPKLETLVDVSPDAILSSPYKNAGHGVIETLKVPIIECADYMETNPLGRAEWILLLGELYGSRPQAKSIYDNTVAEYNRLKETAAQSTGRRPKVLPELLTSGVWYVPGGQSYMAKMLADAGADYPWADDTSSGSLQLDAAAVIDKAADADIWYMRNYGTPTFASLREQSPLYTNIKAFADGEIYNCDTSSSPIFNDIAFHPERILADFISIFHPDAMPGYKPRYFYKVNN